MMPKIYAHRGASADAPENTLAAFDLAVTQNANGIELDVTLSKDGVVVVIHDDTVDRTTNGQGRVRDLTLAELQALDAGQGERIPTLEEVFRHIGRRLSINVELKTGSGLSSALTERVAQLVSAYHLEESVLISSFSPINLRKFHKHLPGVEIGLLVLPHMAKKWFWGWFHHDALHPYYSDVDQSLVEAVHRKNREINVWTVDDPDEILRLAALNVDGIITNRPQHTRQVLESAQ
jgi:glycerophosphoryl diester phosphodiesterase